MEFQEGGVQHPTFIDLFAGCGGLSLGLCEAGWKGRFAIERATDAFETFRVNFLSAGGRHRFEWPVDLEKRAFSIEEVLEKWGHKLHELQGEVDLIAGGPPCQGFSFAGKRYASDPRNKMFQKYVEFVDLVRPKFLILENVPGMGVAHKDGRGTQRTTFYEKLVSELEVIGYDAKGKLLDAAGFGVPQRRRRLVVLGVKRELIPCLVESLNVGNSLGLIDSIFKGAEDEGELQLARFGPKKVTAQEAISDLAIGGDEGRELIEYEGETSPRGYQQISYRGPKTVYQLHMNGGALAMDSMRLAKHSKLVADRFQRILNETQGRRGNLSADHRTSLNMLKHRVVPMDPDAPAPTLTTLPDDVLHYSDPRILTVREYARLQSFPDWFVFRGKYTTGGNLRKVESPRYTQVGNAVPPLLGRALGASLMKVLDGQRLRSNKVISSRGASSEHEDACSLELG